MRGPPPGAGMVSMVISVNRVIATDIRHCIIYMYICLARWGILVLPSVVPHGSTWCQFLKGIIPQLQVISFLSFLLHSIRTKFSFIISTYF